MKLKMYELDELLTKYDDVDVGVYIQNGKKWVAADVFRNDKYEDTIYCEIESDELCLI